MRSVFGPSVTIYGNLLASGYNTKTTSITIQLGEPSGDVYENEWVDITAKSGNVYEAKIKANKGGTLFKNTGVVTFLTTILKQFPKKVRVDNDESWKSVTTENYDEFKTALCQAVGGDCTWNDLTLNDLVDIPVYLKTDDGDIYKLTIVD